MKIRTLFLCSVALWALNGCAYLHSFRSDLVKQVDGWIQEQEYGRALATIEYIKPGHPEYSALQERKKKILPLINQLENKIIEDASAYKKGGKWHEAIQRLNQGMRKLPDSESLALAQRTFIRQREKYLQELELNLLISRGEQLLRDLPLVKEIKRVVPHNWAANTTLFRVESDARDTAEALAEYSEKAIRRSDFDIAEKCLNLAEGLLPDKKTLRRIVLARSQIENQHKRQELRKLAKKLEQNKKRVTEFNEAFRTRKLIEAKTILEKLQSQDVKPDNIQELEEKLNEAIQTRVKEGLATGRRLYTQEKIKEAVKEWEDARLLDPDNKELAEHIERAQRVLKKLKTLSGGKKPPPGKAGGS